MIPASHLLGRRNAEQAKSSHQLLAHQRRDRDQERALFGILFRENVMLVVEDIKGLLPA